MPVMFPKIWSTLSISERKNDHRKDACPERILPYKTLYWEVKDLIGKGKYAFVRKHHAYFGIKKRITLFENPVFAYVYVDQYNALKRFSDYLVDHEDDFADLKAKDKDWYTVKYGYFVLLSNIDSSPKELLPTIPEDRY